MSLGRQRGPGGYVMPEEATLKRAREDKRAGKAPTTQAGEFVREEIHHIREGKHGARSTKQAIAIGLSKARRAGVKLSRPPASAKASTKRSAEYASRAARSGTRRSPRRARAVKRALKREGRAAASRKALARQARTSARRRQPDHTLAGADDDVRRAAIPQRAAGACRRIAIVHLNPGQYRGFSGVWLDDVRARDHRTRQRLRGCGIDDDRNTASRRTIERAADGSHWNLELHDQHVRCGDRVSCEIDVLGRQHQIR